jgi:hypothetical protein
MGSNCVLKECLHVAFLVHCRPDHGRLTTETCCLMNTVMNEWYTWKNFALNLKNTAFKLDKLLHATCRLTYSAIQRTLIYVKLSSMIELAGFYLQSVNLTVQCSWKICSICTYSATPLYKNYCNASLVLIPGTNWRRYFTNLIYRDFDFEYC